MVNDYISQLGTRKEGQFVSQHHLQSNQVKRTPEDYINELII